jgi:hypothetical protein
MIERKSAASNVKNAASNVVASCVTGAAVIAITNPLDCLKQRWQLNRSPHSFPSFVSDILRCEGLIRGLWVHGLATNCLACTISVGCRIGLYPVLRDALSPAGFVTPGAMFASGLAGGALGYVASAPFFYASRVAQAESGLLSGGVLATGARAGSAPSANGTSGIGMLRHLLGKEGFFGLWRASHVLVARGALMSSTQLGVYDASKRGLISRGFEDGTAVHIMASAAASIAMTTAIAPLDVVLTTYQAGPFVGRPYASPLACAASLVAEGGAAALMRGWLPLWGRFLPTSFLTFVIYEQLRWRMMGSFLD